MILLASPTRAVADDPKPPHMPHGRQLRRLGADARGPSEEMLLRTAQPGSNGKPHHARRASRRTAAAHNSSARATASRHNALRIPVAHAVEAWQRPQLLRATLRLGPPLGHGEVD